MATDGIKIMDGDLAKDLYLHFMNSFHKGDNAEQLLLQFLYHKSSFTPNTPEYEICITVYALAFWEIGALTENLLNEVKTVINQKSSVTHYTKEIGKEAGNARQKELDDFWQKITKPNTKPIKRKRQPKPNLFNVGDVLQFQYSDKAYGTAFVVDISKMSGFSFYFICRTRDFIAQPASIQDFLRSKFYASETPTQDASGKPTTQLSVWVNVTERNDLEKFSACFTKIGKISFPLEFGQQIPSNNFQKFCDHNIYKQQVAYTKEIGLHVDEYFMDDFAVVIEA